MRTFLWHDYETFGADARGTRPAQFAAVRTDGDLEPVGEPVVWYCQLADDFLPDPDACRLTGITPQECLERGVAEHEFARRIAQLFAQPETIGVGYNSIRFDDEVTRFLFWRNLIDPYAREWKNGCGRWDLLDVVRAVYALRPDGIAWPRNPDGIPSFRLEDLGAANDLEHDRPHDAAQDVYATIALARLIRSRQPRLFSFCLGLHKKAGVLQELGLPGMLATPRPFWHVSGMYPAQRGCLALVWPLGMAPGSDNELLVWDLAQDPRELAGLSATQMRERMFVATADLPAGTQRLPLKTIHLNKSPVVVRSPKVLDPARAEELGIDLDALRRHAEYAAGLPRLDHVWGDVYKRSPKAQSDVDLALYEGFIGSADRRRLDALRALPPQELAAARTRFDDPRLAELCWRYRARNFPDTLSPAEVQRWQEHRRSRWEEGAGGSLTLDAYLEALDKWPGATARSPADAVGSSMTEATTGATANDPVRRALLEYVGR
ncbi:exodeoxyribonuclease I [Candidatus Symbiobacter mobilis]|uniref:Exodeoxyribonuclease I n=1 Tax=Candidatus Symbiobacter mobilis CR TaxID=946483 RepID=U5NAP0_9BURK|nr:exodeoxyribonuclease I [Candidatus Symbiobacter mobilis]AGX88462.1 exodeoxyribonuclease I [Candidatus Symbiobacter mobilis CR]